MPENISNENTCEENFTRNPLIEMFESRKYHQNEDYSSSKGQVEFQQYISR